MTLLRRLFLTRVGPNVFGASVIQPVLAIVGVFTFLAGVMYLPSLGPTRVEMILALLVGGRCPPLHHRRAARRRDRTA
jgi:hypothetical protein